MTLKTKFGALATLAALGLAAGHPAAAQSTITFGTPTALSGDTDVSNTGTLYDSFYTVDSGQTPVGTPTVNGVTFTQGSKTGSADGKVTVNAASGPYNPSYLAYNTNLSVNYRTVVNTAIYTAVVGSTPTLTISMTGLTAGNKYQFQFFVDEPRNTSGRHETLSDGLGDTSGQLTFDGGSYVLGTFTANSAGTEAFTVNSILQTPGVGFGDTAAQVNAFQVRNITAAPEPSQFAAFGLGLLGLSGLVLKARKRSVIA